MGDELEKFIIQNQKEFDNERPGDHVWRAIQSDIQKKPPLWINWWKVAAVLFFITTAALLIERNLASVNEPQAMAELTEFKQAENYYTRLIAEKKKQIAQYDRSVQQQEFLLEVERLDQMYAELKNTYNKQHSSELLVDAMIANMKLRIDILNQQILILKKLNETTNGSHPNIEI